MVVWCHSKHIRSNSESTTESGTVAEVETSFIFGDLVRGLTVIFFEFVLKNNVCVSSLNNLKFSYKKADYNRIS